MGSTAVVQATVEATLKEQAAAVLAEKGMTLEDAVRLLLEQVVEHHELPLSLQPVGSSIVSPAPPDNIGEAKQLATYDDWFRAEVEEGLREAEDPSTVWFSNEEVSRQLAEFRAECERQIKAGEAHG